LSYAVVQVLSTTGYGNSETRLPATITQILMYMYLEADGDCA